MAPFFPLVEQLRKLIAYNLTNRQLKVANNLLCEDSDAHTLNLLIRWYCDLLDEVGDRAMLKNPAKV